MKSKVNIKQRPVTNSSFSKDKCVALSHHAISKSVMFVCRSFNIRFNGHYIYAESKERVKWVAKTHSANLLFKGNTTWIFPSDIGPLSAISV
jgi:hypothetical protein